MDAREQLRRYLEQRRELGERELVLDDMSVEDVMRVIGLRTGASAPPAERPPSAAPAVDPVIPADPPAAPREKAVDRDAPPTPADADWRTALRAAGAAPPEALKGREARNARVSPESPAEPPAAAADAVPPPAPVAPPPPPPDSAPPPTPPTALASGIVIGAAASELFGGALADLGSLDAIAKAVHECTRCPLHATALHGVPGEGNPEADFVCVGEAPGATEDETGRPFVGAAGQLLTKILAAIDLKREDVFICNVLKHRPPGNRNPLPNEVAACSPYLVRQLELLRPKVILALGTFAAQTLLDTKQPIGKLRGLEHRYYGVPLVVTYHPAALLRNPSWKRPTWEDVQLARRILDRARGA